PAGWTSAGYRVLRRKLTLPVPVLPAELPDTLPLLIPDAASGLYGASLTPRQFLFFDLETTGLSGGAGTTAFLAAFGRFAAPADPKNQHPRGAGKGWPVLELTQFLLLDYPGEPDFLENVLAEAGCCFADSPEPVFLTTYNGKAFDTQILKTRCLLNGLAVPSLLQADLLYPARRLWKRILPNCSQATIETLVLGLDRTGDLPGSMAPGIWFNFLRAGADFSGGPETADLLGICDHNVKDIFGLAMLFRSFTEIAAAPLEAVRRFYCDGENLALRWRRAARPAAQPGLWDEALSPAARGKLETSARLLLEAAAETYPRSCLRLAFDLNARGRYEEARKRFLALRNWQGRETADRTAAVPGRPGPNPPFPETAAAAQRAPEEMPAAVKALALRALAVDADRRLGRRDLALAYIEEALAAGPDKTPGSGPERPLPRGLREDLEKRRERLIRRG
ncbi:MAG: ribonuclease H-like domain-containing protein, partial [Spirochaetaceae bacterium]|nr:ribonuclease H-like domain-containing protein [Spirochaetaceae bacterium]